MTIVIELSGEVVAKGRARVTVTPSGKARVYPAGKTVRYESDLRLAAQTVMNGRPPLTGPLIMKIDVRLPIMPSWSKKKQRGALTGKIWPTKRPDLDNFWKSACDSLNLVVFHDDAQIVKNLGTKRYSDHPGLRIEIEEVL